MSKITADGIYDLSMPVYRGQPCDGMSLSASDAIVLKESTPAHLKVAWAAEDEREHKTNLGTAIHVLALEPFRAHTAIQIIEADDFRTKAAREAADEALNAGMVPLLPETYERAQAAVAAIRAHPDAAPLFAGDAKAEQSYFARDLPTGIYRKCRPDLVNAEKKIIEVKSVASAGREFIRRRIFGGGWYMQAPWHCDVVGAVLGKMPADYLWVCVEQKPPHAVKVYRPLLSTMQAGAKDNARSLAIFSACVKSGEWPAYAAGIEDVGLPDYAHYRMEEEWLREPSTEMEAATYGLETGLSPFA